MYKTHCLESGYAFRYVLSVSWVKDLVTVLEAILTTAWEITFCSVCVRVQDRCSYGQFLKSFSGFPNGTVKMKIQKQTSQRWNPFSDFAFHCKSEIRNPKFSIFLSHIRLKKQHSNFMYLLKICKAWVRSQLRCSWNWLKLNVPSSNVLRIIIHWLSARRDVGLTQGSLIPEEHSQHKLDLNLSKTKQPLPIITNSHLNFRYLTSSANL